MLNSIINQLAEYSGFSPEAIKKLITKPKDSKQGDFALPCFALAKAVGKNPAAIATQLAADLELPADLAKVVATGPYLNLFLDRAAVTRETLREVLHKGSSYGTNPALTDQKIVIEYSSPNIAKPFHIGHLRTTVIGLALDKILTQAGYTTVSINHIGDWGTQFGYVYAGITTWGRADPDYMRANYDIDQLVSYYIKANQTRKEQQKSAEEKPDSQSQSVSIEEIAKQFFLDLEAGKPEAREFWQLCVDISLKYLKKIYAELGAEFDHYTGESFYIDLFETTKKRLEEAQILEESEGALGIDLGDELGFARVVTPDGRSLYLSRDITTVFYREETFNPIRHIYIVGAPQTLYFRQLKAVITKLGDPAAEKLLHIPYGHVPGISTRHMAQNEGEQSSASQSLSLRGLLDEAKARAAVAYHESAAERTENLDEDEVTHAVGIAAIFFNYLSRGNVKDFHFDWEEAVNFHGDTGPYLLYALARLNGIIAKAADHKLLPDPDFAPHYLEREETYQIVDLLGSFPQVLEKTSADFEPNHLARYALELAKVIAKNYKTLRVIGIEDQQEAVARLTLFAAAREVLQISIKCLGIPVLDRM